MHQILEVKCYVTLLFIYLFIFIFYIYLSIKIVILHLQSAWKSFFTIIMVNILNKDQVLIQIMKWEKCNILKMHHNAQPDGPSYSRKGRYKLVSLLHMCQFLHFFINFFALIYNKCHINCQNGFFCTKRTFVIQLNSNFAESNFAFSVKIYGYKNFCF